MEVDSWVSVQARRERFEQLYEDSPLSSQNTPFHPTPRPRTLSTPYKNLQNCNEFRASRDKNAHISNREQDCRTPKCTPPSESSLRSSEVPISGKVLKNNIKVMEQPDHPSQRDERPLESTVTPIPNTAKKIPATSSTSRKNVQERTEKTMCDTGEKRGRFLSHVRSRSHGNFVMKRDSSAEKITVGQQNGVKGHKENKSHKDWLTPKCKQRSIDNLLSGEDSKSRLSFEGKQKLVSNVVKNIKNKETPTVLRKFSFSSKNEKDMKNMKEKSVIPSIRHKQPGILPSISNKSNKQKSGSRDSGINMDHRLITEEKPGKNKSHASDIAIVPVLIAKAVAEVASKKCTPGATSKTSSLSSLPGDERLSDPPSRPPRRRAAGSGPSPRRKGKAPSPPCQSSPAIINMKREIHNDSLFQISSPDESPDITSHRFRDSTDDLKSCESVSSCPSPDKSFENLQEIVHLSSTPVSKIFNTQTEEKHKNNGKKIFRTEIQSVNLRNTKSNAMTETHCDKDETLEQANVAEAEGLPAGLPPKKPPRTFAYDIYKNISMPSLEIDGDDSIKKEKTEEKSSHPIYAVPVKKKNNKMVPKPPVRSKSDLSKEIIKPSVAPKPPHVVAKAKRTSLVDPLSNSEKDEEAAITSEFQRQAHVRYSLRKPNKLPPNSSHNEESSQCSAHSEHKNTSSEIEYEPNYSVIDYDSENNLTSHCSRGNSPGSAEMKRQPIGPPCPARQDSGPMEHEDIAGITSSNLCAENDQPLSLTYCFASTPPDVTHLHNKRSMSDETLYKGGRQDEPVYATPTFKTNNYQRDQASQQELHYMCSVLFTDEEEAEAGRDGADGRMRRSSIQGRERLSGTEAEEGSKARSSLISAWKREFRQSCRQVQSKIKKTVIR